MTADYQTLLSQLQTAIGGLELAPSDPLRREIAALSTGGEAFRIAVFGPFNYGKSTLLNALLGERTLPMDLIPTTGAAIAVRYGPELQTRIQLVDGRIIVGEGIELLQQYAILDDARRMREDVAAVEVWCPHPWLQTGVELLDLPGTNDREAQDALVRDSLLTADLIVQILDGRKLMTLGEREHLRDWLQDRGIETVVFVVNFLNLLEPEEQQQVSQRMRFVAESFRSKLPPGVSNLYRVDALPALRARLKGDMAAAQSAGLPMFEAALQTIAQHQRDAGWQPKGARLKAIALKVCEALQLKIERLAAETEGQTQQQSEQQLEVKRKAQAIIQKGHRDRIASVRDWLAYPNLLQNYGQTLSEALRTGTFMIWETQQFRPDWENYRKSTTHWVHKACDFFSLPQPADLWLSLPPEPALGTPPPETPPAPPSKTDEAAPVAIATGLGLVMGGPVGAAVLGGASFLLNRMAPSAQNTAPPTDSARNEQIYRNAAAEYLMQWSQLALQALETYEKNAKTAIDCPLSADVSESDSPQQHQLRFLRSMLMALNDALA
ncbi:dynamin family protein [Altericista sp. CCNU0014]|uniref:dynamin family protein n=1 Tax=Altericista sp. CCNU0014 TaxID=3082949 RepID=UPI00384DCADD